MASDCHLHKSTGTSNKRAAAGGDDDGEDDNDDDDGEDDNDDETKTAEEEGRVIYQESLMRGRVRWPAHLFPWLPISHCLRNQEDVA